MSVPADASSNADLTWALQVYGMFARGDGPEQMVYLEVPGNPWSKSRPRFARGRAYQSRDDQVAEQALRTRLIANKLPKFPGNVLLACRFYRSNYQRIDTDNLLKHVGDAATGVLWQDDSQVTCELGEVHLDAERPRTIIVAGHHSSTLTRGSDGGRACAHCGATFQPSAGKRRDVQRFCQTACAYAARTTKLAPMTCKHCGIEFQPNTKTRSLCSPECRTAYLSNRRRGRGGPPSTCAQCGKTLSHRRGGRCRGCWRREPRFYADGAA